jgi:hypothetical protein
LLLFAAIGCIGVAVTVVAAGVVIAVRAVVSFSPSCLLGCGVSVVAFFFTVLVQL